MDVYYKHSKYLMDTYGERVYKLPINLPLTCPNRDGKIGVGGCIFCGESGAGFDSLPSSMSITKQLEKNMDYIGKKYKAKKFIAYFQNYTNTYLPVRDFEKNIKEAAVKDVVEIAVSTRPDCIEEEYLDVLSSIKEEKGVNITVEMGLQSSNDNTLKIINRGHSVKDFTDSVKRIKKRNFKVVAHLIMNLPWDSEIDILNGAKICNNLALDGVKMHSLYIVKNTILCDMYKKGDIKMIPYEDFKKRVILFLSNLSPYIVIERLLGRAPESEVVFENYGMSWRRICDEIVLEMKNKGIYQGRDMK